MRRGARAARAAPAARGGRRAGDGAVRRRGGAREPGAARSGGAPRRRELHRLLPGRRGRQPLRLPRAVRGAASGRVSQLELELQAEVDKFVCCFLRDGRGDAACAGGCSATSPTPTIWTPTSASATAPRTSEAGRYAAALERRFVAREQTVRAARRAAALLSHGSARQAGAHRPARLIRRGAGGRGRRRRSRARPPARSAPRRRARGPTAAQPQPLPPPYAPGSVPTRRC